MTVYAYIEAADGAVSDLTVDPTNWLLITVTFTVAAKINATTVKFQLKKTGTPTGYLKASLSYNYHPETLIVESQQLDISTLTAAYAEYTFTFVNPTVLYPEIVYTVMLKPEFGTFPGGNEIKISAINSATLYHFQLYNIFGNWGGLFQRPIFSLEGTAVNDGETAIASFPAVDTATRILSLYSSHIILDRNHPTAENTPHRSAAYETFATPAYYTQLSHAAFMMTNEAATGNGALKVKVYEVTGTVNVDEAPTGTALAESEPETPTRAGWISTVLFTFTGPNRIALEPSHRYALTVEAQSGFDDTHRISQVGTANAPLYANGNWGRYFNSAWGGVAVLDGYFTVHAYDLRLCTTIIKNFENKWQSDGYPWGDRALWVPGLWETDALGTKVIRVLEAKGGAHY